jgi:hypothetical protein
VIGELFKMAEAFRAGVAAARAVMDDRLPVLIEDLEVMGCSCPRQRAVIVHNKGLYCGDSQRVLIGESLGFDEPAVDGVLDILAAEADRRDGRIR